MLYIPKMVYWEQYQLLQNLGEVFHVYLCIMEDSTVG